MKGKYIGEFELAILLACARLADEATAMRIQEEVLVVGNRVTVTGAVYATIDRMCGKKYLQKKQQPPRPVRGGRATYYYTVTKNGRSAIRTALALTDALRENTEFNRPDK